MERSHSGTLPKKMWAMAPLLAPLISVRIGSLHTTADLPWRVVWWVGGLKGEEFCWQNEMAVFSKFADVSLLPHFPAHAQAGWCGTVLCGDEPSEVNG